MKLWMTGLAVAAIALFLIGERAYPASRVREVSAGETARFPEVTGKNLEGKEYSLPRGFEGEVNLCLIAYTQEQQNDINTWLEKADAFAGVPGLAYYELPTLPESNPAFRIWLDSVMTKGIPDKAQRERTITLYLDKKAFRKSLNLSDEKTIHVVLTDRAGKVLWQDSGRYSDAKLAALRKALPKKEPGKEPGNG